MVGIQVNARMAMSLKPDAQTIPQVHMDCYAPRKKFSIHEIVDRDAGLDPRIKPSIRADAGGEPNTGPNPVSYNADPAHALPEAVI